MSLHELEQAVAQLSPEERAQFDNWYEELKAEEWDKQIERDAAAGKLDKLFAKADADFEAGRCKPL